MLPGTDNHTLGAFLRTLRETRRLGTEQAARAAGLNRVTLYRWEQDRTLPRLAELQAYLAALEADTPRRNQALALLEAPRARAQAQDAVAHAADRLGILSLPSGGDLLRALRKRRLLSVEAVAAQMGVTPRSVQRWEKGEVWPSAETLHALCGVLGASQDDFLFLTRGPFATGIFRGEPVSLDRIQADLDIMWSHNTLGPLDAERAFRTLEAQVWYLVTHGQGGQAQLAQIYTQYADLLNAQHRRYEMGRYANAALDLMPRKLPEAPFWVMAGIISAEYAVYGQARPAPRRGLNILNQWLPEMSEPTQRAWALALMAEYMVLDGEPDAGLPLAERAFRIASAEANPYEALMRKRDWAVQLLKAGRPREAMPLLVFRESDAPQFQVEILLLRVKAFLALSAKAEAHTAMLQAQTLIEIYGLDAQRQRAATLYMQM